MNPTKGKIIPLSLPRRWVGDLVTMSQRVPTVAAEMLLSLGPLVEARKQATYRPSWCALITKSYGIASTRIPELRRSYLGFPFARLYEHPTSVASFVINRPFEGEAAVFAGMMQAPEARTLPEIDAHLKQLTKGPIYEVGAYRRLIRTSRLPLPLRRFVWWYGLTANGLVKSRTFGTFSVNGVSASRCEAIQFLLPITSTLYYGSLNKAGEMKLQMAFDHRVFDGSTASKALGELEKILSTEMVAELSAG